MHAGSQRGREADVARHDQYQSARPADPRKVAAQTGAIGVVVVPEHDTREAARQPGDGASRIGQPLRVGEQPQRWNPASP
jgi:hypothetical protein